MNNLWVTYDNSPLRESIRNYTNFPIATIFDEHDPKKQQPRLLLVSVDAEEGEAVTFDSYKKEDEYRKSEYGSDDEGSNSDTDADYSAHDSSNDQQTGRGYKDIIRYDQGIIVNMSWQVLLCQSTMTILWFPKFMITQRQKKKN